MEEKLESLTKENSQLKQENEKLTSKHKSSKRSYLSKLKEKDEKIEVIILKYYQKIC